MDLIKGFELSLASCVLVQDVRLAMRAEGGQRYGGHNQKHSDRYCMVQFIRANLPAVKFRIVCKHLQSSICAQTWKFKLSYVASMDLLVRVSVFGEKRSTSVRVNDGVARRECTNAMNQ